MARIARRRFLQSTSALAATTSFGYFCSTSLARRSSPDERPKITLIGWGGQTLSLTVDNGEECAKFSLASRITGRVANRVRISKFSSPLKVSHAFLAFTEASAFNEVSHTSQKLH